MTTKALKFGKKTKYGVEIAKNLRFLNFKRPSPKNGRWQPLFGATKSCCEIFTWKKSKFGRQIAKI